MEEVLAIADLFILPSGHESFGLAALEAMACEVPVISSNAGGLPEVNLQGVTGYLEDPGAVEQMAEDAMSILSDPEKHKVFRANAYRQAQRFSLENILPEYEAYYQKVLDRASALIG